MRGEGDELTARLACEALATLGLRVTSAEVVVERREHRWLVRLPESRLAWFAASPEGRRRLVTERRVLRLLAQRCRFAAPRLLTESANGDFDVRAMVPGAVDPWAVYAAARDDAAVARRLGTAIGAILAEQHAGVHPADVDEWLPTRLDWPKPAAWIHDRLPAVTDDAALIADARTILTAYEALPVLDAERALVHGDVGFHNLAIDPGTFTVQGIFDYDDPAWADRHHDFQYLVFDLDDFALLEAARAAYEPVTGRSISTGRVLLYNAACALTFLAHRLGSTPDERPCGRTLTEDLHWTRLAIARVLNSPSALLPDR